MLYRAPGRSFMFPIFFAVRLCSTSKNASSARAAVTRSSVSLTAAEFAQIAPMILLRETLRRHIYGGGADGDSERGACREVISRELFNRYCAESHVGDSDKALQLLAESGCLVSLAGGTAAHLRPAQFLRVYEECGGAGGPTGEKGGEFFLDEAAARLAAAQAEEAAMLRELQPALRVAARWRRVVWGGALFLMGAHMAIVSRLTFFELDWDTMEPLTYFFAASASILFYLFFLRHGRSCAFSEYDKTMLSKKVRKYTSSEFDWEKYGDVIKRIDEERVMMEKIRAWLRQH